MDMDELISDVAHWCTDGRPTSERESCAMVAVAQERRPLPRIAAWRAAARLRRLVRQPVDLVVELAAGGEISPFVNSKSFFVNTPQLAYELVVQHAGDVERSTLDRGNLLPLVGESVLTAVPPAHRRQRKLFAPAFNLQRVMAYDATIAALSHQLQQSSTDSGK